MNEQTYTPEAVQKDAVAEDFKNAVFVVSLVANLTVFVAWLVVALA